MGRFACRSPCSGRQRLLGAGYRVPGSLRRGRRVSAREVCRCLTHAGGMFSTMPEACLRHDMTGQTPKLPPFSVFRADAPDLPRGAAQLLLQHDAAGEARVAKVEIHDEFAVGADARGERQVVGAKADLLMRDFQALGVLEDGPLRQHGDLAGVAAEEGLGGLGGEEKEGKECTVHERLLCRHTATRARLHALPVDCPQRCRLAAHRCSHSWFVRPCIIS